MKDMMKAWEHTTKEYVRKNNKIFQEKQINLIRILARTCGITVKSAYVDEDGVAQLDFDVDYYDEHHMAFMERVEMIMQAQTAFELVEVASFLHKELG